MRGRRRQILFGALGLAVVVVTFVVVLPKIANYGDVWRVVKTLDTAWLLALFAAAETLTRYLFALAVSDLFACLARSPEPAALPASADFDLLRKPAKVTFGG